MCIYGKMYMEGIFRTGIMEEDYIVHSDNQLKNIEVGLSPGEVFPHYKL